MKGKPAIRPTRVNIKLLLILLIVAALPGCGLELHAAEPAESLHSYRPFDEEQLERLRSDDDFDYEIRKYSRFPLWQAFLKKLEDIMKGIFGVAPSGRTIEITFYILMGLVLLWAIIRLAGIEKNLGLKKGPVKDEELPHNIREENIHEIDFAREMEEARQAQRWRLLIRLQYLYALKLLSNAGLVEVKAGKTNHDYLYEISRAEAREVFARLSHIFEYTWYGHFEADEKVRQTANDQALQLQQILRKR